MPFPSLQPAPPNIAARGEGPDPEPYAHLKKEAELADRVHRLRRLTPLSLCFALGAALGALSLQVSVVALGALILAAMLVAAYVRYRALLGRAELEHLRAAMVMPVKVIEPPTDAGLGIVVKDAP